MNKYLVSPKTELRIIYICLISVYYSHKIMTVTKTCIYSHPLNTYEVFGETFIAIFLISWVLFSGVQSFMVYLRLVLLGVLSVLIHRIMLVVQIPTCDDKVWVDALLFTSALVFIPIGAWAIMGDKFIDTVNNMVAKKEYTPNEETEEDYDEQD